MIINMYDTQNIWNINGKINRLKYVNFEYIKNNYLDNIFKYCIENLYFYIDNNLEKVFAKKLELYMFHKFKDLSSYNIKNTIEFICNRIFKFDILQKYIDNVEISRIRIVKYDKIFVKKGDKWQAIKEKFNNEDEIKYLINSILIRNNIKNNGNLSSILLEDKKYNLNFCYDLDKKVVDIKISRETKYNLKELYNKNKILDDISYKVLLTVINENSNILIIGQNDTTINMILIAIIEYLKNKNSFVVDSKNRNIFLDNLVRIDIKKENIDLLQDNMMLKY